MHKWMALRSADHELQLGLEEPYWAQILRSFGDVYQGVQDIAMALEFRRSPKVMIPEKRKLASFWEHQYHMLGITEDSMQKCNFMCNFI